MTNLIQKIEQSQLIERPDFRVGDRLKVGIRITEGNKERVQYFEGVCIGRNRKNSNLNATFRVRKVSFGVGIERVFQLHSPSITEIIVLRKGLIRQAKPYYLRDRSQKGARIKERFAKRTQA